MLSINKYVIQYCTFLIKIQILTGQLSCCKEMQIVSLSLMAYVCKYGNIQRAKFNNRKKVHEGNLLDSTRSCAKSPLWAFLLPKIRTFCAGSLDLQRSNGRLIVMMDMIQSFECGTEDCGRELLKAVEDN